MGFPLTKLLQPRSKEEGAGVTELIAEALVLTLEAL